MLHCYALLLLMGETHADLQIFAEQLDFININCKVSSIYLPSLPNTFSVTILSYVSWQGCWGWLPAQQVFGFQRPPGGLLVQKIPHKMGFGKGPWCFPEHISPYREFTEQNINQDVPQIWWFYLITFKCGDVSWFSHVNSLNASAWEIPQDQRS